jgi:hypothetical protein
METAMIHNILNTHRHTIADLAANIGIDYNKIANRLQHETHGTPITRGIHKSKQYRGKVYCFVHHWRNDNDGKTYPTIIFGTHKHGGISETFNGYREVMAAKGYSNAWITRQLPPPPPKFDVLPPIESLEQWQISALNAAKIAFDSANNENVATHDYILKKGISIDGCDIRRVVGGKFDNCLLIAIKDSIGMVIGYQSIDSKGNKKFIGRVSGGVIVIGDKSQIQFGAIYCEGLATGLSIYHSNSTAKGELNNARQLPVIVCLSAHNLRHVVASNAVKYGADAINIYADNDCGKESGNTGVFVALQTCKQFGIKSFMLPVSENGEKCDFNDTLKFQKVRVPKNWLEYLAALVKVAPTQSLKRHWQRLALAYADTVPATRSIEDCVNAVIAVTSLRGVNVQEAATSLIRRSVKRRLERVRKRQTIVNKTVFDTIDNVDGLAPVDVAARITARSIFNKTLTFDNRGMGGNKTNTMVERAKHLTGGTAYISPLTSVCKNSGDRLGFFDYQSVSPAFVSSHRVNLSLCINSIVKFAIAQNFTHLFIDEAAAVYAAIFDDTGTIKDNQQPIVDELKAAFAVMDSILIADAGLNDTVVAFFKSLAGDKTVTLIETTPQISEKNHWLLQNHAHSHEFILRDVKAGKRGVVACDTVANAIEVHKFLVKNGVNPSRILLATGENNGDENPLAFIEKPNDNAYKYDVVIHSPIIRSGTSIEYAEYSFSYLLYDGIISTADAMQMLGRNRCATDCYVSFGKLIDTTRITDFELLLNGEVESRVSEMNNKGIEITVAELRAKYNHLATLRHEFTADKNADLNDFKNNFLLFGEISGRNFVRVLSEATMNKNLSKEVKAERVADRFNAEVKTESECQQLENSNLHTQAQTDSIKRHKTVRMVGSPDITVEDVANELDGKADVLDAFEFLHKEKSELNALDKAEVSATGTLKFSRVLLQKAILDVVKPLQRATENGGITRKDFEKSADQLEKHAAILALARFGEGNLKLGNFKKISRVRPGATIRNFAAKIGYDINDISVTHKRRIYEVKPNDDISRYATNRKGLTPMDKGR